MAISVLPPPISIIPQRSVFAAADAPRKLSSASSSPLMIRSGSPVSRSTASMNSLPFAASRAALVANTAIFSAPCSEASVVIRRTAETVLSMESLSRLPAASRPANRRVPSRSRRRRLKSAPLTSARRLRTELDPIPITAVFTVILLNRSAHPSGFAAHPVNRHRAPQDW